MDIRDQIILQHAPVIACPKYSNDLPPMTANSHRFIATQDGLWIEVHRPWLHLLWPLAVSEIPLPYGTLERTITWPWNRAQLVEQIKRFIAHARDALPNEAAAWVMWSSAAPDHLIHLPLEPETATPGSIRYRTLLKAPSESLVIDLHSHGEAPAFWSSTDDEDDTGEVKIAIVVGEVNDNKPAVRIRLCALGLFIDLDSPL